MCRFDIVPGSYPGTSSPGLLSSFFTDSSSVSSTSYHITFLSIVLILSNRHDLRHLDFVLLPVLFIHPKLLNLQLFSSKSLYHFDLRPNVTTPYTLITLISQTLIQREETFKKSTSLVFSTLIFSYLTIPVFPSVGLVFQSQN